MIFSEVKAAEALIGHRGSVRAAAEQLGVSRWALYKRIQGNPELEQILEDARESNVDDAENSLREAVREGESWAVLYTLRTHGRKRGYFEHSDEYVLDRLEKLEAALSRRAIVANPDPVLDASEKPPAIGTGDV